MSDLAKTVAKLQGRLSTVEAFLDTPDWDDVARFLSNFPPEDSCIGIDVDADDYSVDLRIGVCKKKIAKKLRELFKEAGVKKFKRDEYVWIGKMPKPYKFSIVIER